MGSFYHYFILCCAVVVLLSNGGRAQGFGFLPKKSQPNIVMIMTDDMGWHDFGFHGADDVKTPNIDALAYNGVILNRYYSLPICSPSRSSYLTGRHAIRLGMQGMPISVSEARGVPLKEKLLPEYLKELGYTTRLLGKWHLGYYTDKHTPTKRGFDSFTGYYSGYVKYYNHSLTKQHHNGIDFHKNVGDDLKPYKKEQYLTDLISDEAEEIIRSHDKSKPLYLQVSHLAGHASEGKDNLEVRDIDEVNKDFGYIQNMKRRRYAGIVKAMDESVGKLVNALKLAKMLPNTVIIFVSDNGAPSNTTAFPNYGSNYPLRGAKSFCFEGGVRVPSLVFSPLIKKRSRVSEELIHITDWLPTILGLAGGDPSKLRHLDGVNQWEMISDGAKSKREAVLLNIDEQLKLEGAIRGKYKLVRSISEESTYYSVNYNQGAPAYDIESVRTSLAGRALDSLSFWGGLRNPKVRQIRTKATINCPKIRNPTDSKDCTEGCLFDIYADPCETNDISGKNPKEFQFLKAYISDYYGGLMNQTNTYHDPAGYPENFGGFWQPWLKEEFTPPADRNMSVILSIASYCEGFEYDDPRNCL